MIGISGLFKNTKGAKEHQTREILAATPKITVSCEDQNTVYATFPDGVRLIFRDGEYQPGGMCAAQRKRKSSMLLLNFKTIFYILGGKQNEWKVRNR